MIVNHSPYPQCYEAKDDERPNHNNWVIPDGTNIIVDFDSVVKARIAEVIGEDERLEHPNDMDNVLAAAQNALRAEQRKRAGL